MPVTFDYLSSTEKRLIRDSLVTRKEKLEESIRMFQMVGDFRASFCQRDLEAIEKLLEKFKGTQWS